MQENIVSKLLHWSVQLPQKKVFTYLDGNGKVEKCLNYAELEVSTRLLASYLLSPNVGIVPGDRVLLVFLPSLDFIVAFLACLRAGIIAVPVYPPNPQNLRAQTAQFASICASSGAKIALTHRAYQSMVSLSKLKDFATSLFSSSRRKEKINWPDLKWVDTTDIPSKGVAENILIDTMQPNQIAFLQYTSGSTSYPKGVMITHDCLNSNLRIIIRALEASTNTVVASWLPQYHDMGLIGSYLGTIWCGGRGVYMSPLTFIRNPLLWIGAISVYQATHIQAPNFAYGLAARRIEEAVAGLGGWSALPPPPPLPHSHPLPLPLPPDVAAPVTAHPAQFSLASLRHCFNAAEPISLPVLLRWAHAAVPFGWDPSTLSPGYGLAEHTVYVCDRGSLCLLVDKLDMERSGSVRVLDEVPLWTLGVQPKTEACRLQRVVDTGVCPDPELGGQNTLVTPVVSCGPIWPYAEAQGAGSSGASLDVCVLVVDKETLVPLPEGSIGEIWITGPSMAGGYWQDPQKTLETFGSRIPQGADLSALPQNLPESVAAGTFLRSGDLGFHYRGELYVTGRSKDLIIAGGRNLYPQDIEQTVEESIAQVRKGCTAAFSVRSSPLGGASASSSDAGEVLVVATELRPDVPPSAHAGLAAAILHAISRDHGVRPSVLLLLAPHTLQKTTSGKVARHWNAVAYNGFAATPASTGPWAAPGTVLYAWRDDAAGVAANLGLAAAAANGSGSGDAELGGAAVASGIGGAVADGAAVGGGAGTPMGPFNTPDKRSLVGVELLSQLRLEFSTLLGTDPLVLPVTHSLRNLGFDSLSLVQLAPRLRVEYGLQVTDAQVFEDGCTIEWLTMNAEALRQGPVEVPVVEPSAQTAPATSPAPAPPKQSFMVRHCPCFLICCNN